MKYAHISVRFPEALDTEIEQFLDETGVYTNKSEFIKEACRTHLCQLNSEAAITALRTEKLLARAEQETADTAELTARLEESGEKVDPNDLADAVDQAREETAKSVFGQ